MKTILCSIFLLLTGLSMAQVPNYVPQNGLKSYWPFNGNTNDASSAASHLTNNGAVLTADRNGVANSAYSFNGTNQSMVQLTPNWTFSSTTDFTVSAWVLKPSTASGVCLMNGSTAGGNFIWLMQGGGTMSFGANKQQASWINISTPYTANVWTHYVCVYEAGVMKYYQDNVLVGTANFTHTGVTSANLPFYVGKGLSGGFFTASIDDIGVWDRALTACEISDLYTSTATIIAVNGGVDQSICNGTAVTLQGTHSGVSAQWDNGVTDGIAFTPAASATYTYTTTDANGCTSWDQVDIIVSQGLIDGGVDQTVCDGTAITLNGSNATGLVWSNGVTDGVSFVPAVSGSYFVSGTDNLGCYGTDTVLVTLVAPTVVVGNDLVICAGASVTLTASGATSYSWNNGVSNGVSYVPTSSGYYTVIGTDAMNCTDTDSLHITVKPPSNIQAGPDMTTCAGDFFTLTATGGLYYIWNNGVVNGSPFIPQTSGLYIVTGADTSNCVNKDSVYVTVNQASASSITIDAIDQYNLNGTVYSTSGTYTQVIQNAAGCDSTITLVLSLAFTGIDELANEGMMISPNPASDVLNVKINEKQIGEKLQCYTADGRLVKTIILTATENKMDISELKNGIYICRFEGNFKSNFKWVKQ